MARKKKSRKRVVVLGDTHCGHFAGLTPPDWHWNGSSQNPRIQAIFEQQKAMWNWYAETIKALQPVDILFGMGDFIDGKGSRSGGTEQNVADMNEQAKMAAQCINLVKAPQICLVYGTPYHVGADQDMEDVIIPELNGKAEISGQAWYDVNGICFDLKHFQGNSQIPHGVHTAKARAKLWNQIWAYREQQPKADILLRAHVHHYEYNYESSTRCLAVSTPSLQGFGSKFGVRRCEGVVDMGLLMFDVESDGSYHWWAELCELSIHKDAAKRL